MKIKMDFISNSSSTSFIYISSGKFNENSFYNAVGISKDSPIFNLFERMYHVLHDSIKNGKKVNYKSQLIQDEKYPKFTPEVIDRAIRALSKGENVVIGRLDSDGDVEESFLCMDIFEIESDDFYINGFDNYW